MGMPGYLWEGITDKIDLVKTDVLSRIDDLMRELIRLRARVLMDDFLNDLGELQNRPPMLDARVATLATLQRMKRDLSDEDRSDFPEGEE